MSDNIQNLSRDDINFDKIFKLVFRNLWMFVICLVVAVGSAFLYNKYSVPSYKVSSSILIKEDNSQPLTQGMDNMFSGNIFGNNQNLQNELIIIQSYPIIEKTIKNLDLEVAYYEFKDYQYHDAYHKAPFKIFFFDDHPQAIGTMFDLKFNADGSFNLMVKDKDVTLFDYKTRRKVGEKDELDLNIKGSLGQVVESKEFKFIVQIEDENLSSMNDEKQYAFKLLTNEALSRVYQKKLQFSIVDKNATVIDISLETTSVLRGKAIINELIRVYSANNLAEKNHIANMTIEYIDKQLQEVSHSLNLTEDSLQKFLSKNQLVAVEDQASSLSGQLVNLQNALAELMTQKRYFTYVGDYLAGGENETQIIAPSSMGVQDPLLNKLILDLSTAQSTKANLIQNGQERNPIVQRLTFQIDNLKKVVSENIASAKTSNEMSIEEMEKRIAQVEREIRKLPKTKLQLGGIQRSYQLNDAIYNYLLQKHAEAKITKASNLPDNIVVAPAHMVGSSPVSPNKRIVNFAALFLGIGVPMGILLLIYLLRQTVETRDDLERISNAPILGTILHTRNKKEVNVFKDRPQSNIAESYRSLRTNINFYLKNKEQKVLLITSTVSGEGKTFNALNISSSYAGLGHKTILVNCDMRKGTKIIDTGNTKIGLSTYLAGKNDLKDIIHKGEMENLHYIPAGPIPPNPMELIASLKTNELMKNLKENYDCIVLDGTPLAQVTDSFSLVQFADVCLLVSRYKYTNKKVLKLVLKDLKQKEVDNVAIMLNGNRILNEQYGYGYGYYTK